MVQNFENQNTQDVLPYKGKITTVMYYEPETGFAIFKIRQEGETKSSTAKGYVPNPVAGAKIFCPATLYRVWDLRLQRKSLTISEKMHCG